MAVYSFMDKHDLNNKKIYHFCTHEGSSGVKDGFAIYGHRAKITQRKLIKNYGIVGKIGY